MRDIWAAVGLAESLSLAAFFFLVVAFFSSLDLDSCHLFDCRGELSISVGFVLMGAVGLGILFGASLIAASRSGWAIWRAVLQAICAFVAFWVVLVLGAKLFAALVGEYAPALVLALGVQGLFVIRPPSAGALRGGVVAVAVAVAVAAAAMPANSFAAFAGTALLVLPAIGFAYTLAVPRERSPAPYDWNDEG